MSNVLFNKQETLNAIETIALRDAHPVDIQDQDGVLVMTLSDQSIVGWSLDTLHIKDEIINWSESDMHNKLSTMDETILDGFITTSVIDGETKQQYLGDLAISDFKSLDHLQKKSSHVDSTVLKEKGARLFTIAFTEMIKREYDRLKDRMNETTNKYWEVFVSSMERAAQAK